MKNFLKIAAGLEVMPLVAAIQMRPHLWNQNTLRTSYPGTVHSEVDDIWLRFNEVKKRKGLIKVANDIQCVNYPAFFELPEARPLVFGVMGNMHGEQLGRCMITRLPPGGRIAPHEDQGAPATFYDRFHVVLQAGAGCQFRCGDETVEMKTAELWWFQNQVEHEVINNSSIDRIHLIVDVRVRH